MIKRVNNIIQETLKTDVEYYELAEYIITRIKNNESEYNYLIDDIQVLVMRLAYRFMTYMEVEDLYNKIKLEVC